LKHKFFFSTLFIFSASVLIYSISNFYLRSIDNEIIDLIYEQSNIINIDNNVSIVDSSLKYTVKFIDSISTYSNEDNPYFSFNRIAIEDYYLKGCGGSSLLLAKVLSRRGLKFKFVQLRYNNIWGSHIDLEVQDNPNNLLVDPSLNYMFRDSSNNPISIETVCKDWHKLIKYLPSNYNLQFDYQEGYRYTNWDKFGSVSRFAYRISCRFFGKEKVDNFSLRSFFIDEYFFRAISSIIILIIPLVLIRKNLVIRNNTN